METIKIEGIATFSKNGFSFNSGLPSEETLVTEQNMRGTMKVSKNGCAEFKNRNYVYLPPLVTRISDGENYKIKRTSRHYIIQIKVPVVECRTETETTMQGIVSKVVGEIISDRKELLNG